MKLYKTHASLRRHLSLQCKKKPKHCCNLCSYKSYFRSNLVRHIQEKHLPRFPTINKCEKCGLNFPERARLLRHLKTCGQPTDPKLLPDTKFYWCDHCQYKSHRKEHITTHIKSKHLPRDPKSTICGKCGKTYSWRSDLVKHLKLCGLPRELKNSSQFKRYSCDHCSHRAFTKSNLTRHIQAMHLPRGPKLEFKCLKCEKNFCSKSYLKIHTKIVHE